METSMCSWHFINISLRTNLQEMITYYGIQLFRFQHNGHGGPGRGSHASRHVYRHHGPQGAPPLAVGDRGQRHRRGGQRLRQRDQRDPEQGRLRHRVRQWKRHPRGHPREAGRVRRGGGLHPAPCGRQVRLRLLRLLRRPPRRGRVGGERPVPVGHRGGVHPEPVL